MVKIIQNSLQGAEVNIKVTKLFLPLSWQSSNSSSSSCPSLFCLSTPNNCTRFPAYTFAVCDGLCRTPGLRRKLVVYMKNPTLIPIPHQKRWSRPCCGRLDPLVASSVRVLCSPSYLANYMTRYCILDILPDVLIERHLLFFFYLMLIYIHFCLCSQYKFATSCKYANNVYVRGQTKKPHSFTITKTSFLI